MISYLYRNIKDSKLQKISEFKVGTWTHVVDPNEKELKKLAEEFNLDISLLRDALDVHEVPRLEIEDDYVYIYTRYPSDDKDDIKTYPILFCLTDKFLATVSLTKPDFINSFLESSEFYTTQKVKLLLQLIQHLNKTHNTYLNQISKKIRSIEVKLEKIKNSDIIQFVAFEGILNDFRPVLVRTNAILDALLKSRHINLYEKDKDLVEDIMLSNKQLIEVADDSIRTIKNIREAYSTIMTNNLNRVVKLLTSVTVILTIPTMIASIYGMNVPLPFSDQPWAFVAILLLIVAITGAILLTFIREDFL